MAEKLCQLKKKGGSGGGGGSGSIPNFNITKYTNQNGSTNPTYACEKGDVIVVSKTSPNGSITVVSGGTIIDRQTSSSGKGAIIVATDTSITLSWGNYSSDVKIIHTDKLKSSTYTIEKSCTQSLASKVITDLTIGDIIVGNAANTASAYNNITKVVYGAPLDADNYYGQVFMVISDTANVTLGGSSAAYSIVAFRQ